MVPLKVHVSFSKLRTTSESLSDGNLSGKKHFDYGGSQQTVGKRVVDEPLTVSVSALMTLIDFTLSNARRFYSLMGNPSDT